MNFTLRGSTIFDVQGDFVISGGFYFMDTIFSLPPQSGHIGQVFLGSSQLVTSNHGTITADNPPVGFRPTDNLIAHFNMSGTWALAELVLYIANASVGNGPTNVNLADNTPFLSIWAPFYSLDANLANPVENMGQQIYNPVTHAGGVQVTGNYIIDGTTWALSQDGTNLTITSNGTDPNLLNVDQIVYAWDTGAGGKAKYVAQDTFTKTASQITATLPQFCTFTGDVQVYVRYNSFYVYTGKVTI